MQGTRANKGVRAQMIIYVVLVRVDFPIQEQSLSENGSPELVRETRVLDTVIIKIGFLCDFLNVFRTRRYVFHNSTV